MTFSHSPFYVKSTLILFGLVLMTFVLSKLGEILIPISFGLLLAILLNPVSNLLQRHISRTGSIVLSLLGGLVIIVLVGFFLTSQISLFTDELPVLEKKMSVLGAQWKEGIGSVLGLSVTKIDQMTAEGFDKAKPFFGRLLESVVGLTITLFVIPVYTFLFMFYKSHLLNFFYGCFENHYSKEIKLILSQTKGAIQSYMVGLLLEGLIVGALNITALFVLGVKYAILLGALGAILNVLPYIGGIIAIALPVLVATITKDGFHTQIAVIISYLVIQFIDNHFLVPYIVSSKVKINALVSIIIVLLGGSLWGVPGMFLSIPFIGVMKIVFDRIPELKPWGKLLGNEVPSSSTESLSKSAKKPAKH